MSRDLSASLLRVTALTGFVTWLALIFATSGVAKETDPGGKDADTEAEIVFEPTSEGKAAADNPSTEEPIDFDSKRPSILGMTVIEDGDGRARVVDVGASSPAWDAGIRNDDVIVSLHGVKAKSFQEWADGVRKVVADTKAGQTIPVQVIRDGSPLDMQVRISEQKDIKPPRPVRARRQDVLLNQAPPNGQQPIPAGGVPYPVGVGGGYGGFGVVDDGTASDQVPTRAAAQLMAVNNRAGTAPAPGPIPTNTPSPANDPTNAAGAVQPPGGTAPGTFPSRPASPTGAAPGTSGVAPGTFPNNASSQPGTGKSGQVGTAEFADAAGGMMAIVTLDGLPPGTYRVGIGEFNGSAGGGFVGPDSAPVTDRNSDSERLRGTGNRSRQLRNSQGLPPGQNPGDFELYNSGQQGARGATPPTGGQRAPTPPAAGSAPDAGGTGTGGAASGGAGDGGAANIPRSSFYVLAQVTPAAGAQSPPNPSEVPNAATPPTNSTGRNQPGQPGSPNQARELPPPQPGQTTQPNQPGAVPAANAGLTGGQFGIELGVVTVRPNGGGQLQQLIEGIRVANVVGQSVVVVPADVPVAGGARGAGQRHPAATQNPGSIGVVATGVIQLFSSGQTATQQQTRTNRNTTPGGTAQGSSTSTTQPVQPGANSTQQAPQQSPTGLDRTQR